MSTTSERGCFKVEWLSTGVAPVCPPNPAFPYGKAINLAREGEDRCTVEFPYPAACVGAYVATCSICGLRVQITAAGRPDDPTTLTIPCLGMASA